MALMGAKVTATDGFNVNEELNTYLHMRNSRKYAQRNFEYFLLREAMEGRFRWPKNWPDHKPKLVWNLVKPIVLRFSALMMGRGFSISVEPATQDAEDRTEAQVVERALYRIIDHSGGWAVFSAGAQDASLLGNAVIKTYIDGDGWPAMVQCTPDYFYGVPESSNYMGELAKVYYGYYLDRLEADRLFPEYAGDFKSERQVIESLRPDHRGVRTYLEGDYLGGSSARIPVLEVWTRDHYALIVGGVVIENGKNPYGFVPFTSITNIRLSGQVEGQGDVHQVLTINEELNQVLSHRAYIVRRWLNPTLVWERAPQNYREIIAGIVGGGGVIPAANGASVKFLAHEGQGPEVIELIDRLRAIALENANLNELALTGNVSGSINTGASLEQQFLPVTAGLEEKRRWWEIGLQRVFAQLLELTQHATARKEYGVGLVHGDPQKRSRDSLAEVPLEKSTLARLRQTKIHWPGSLARDDDARARLEIEKHAAGVQSLFTTLENLGHEFPDDEIARLASEREDPRLAPKENAALAQGEAALMRAENQGGGPNLEDFLPPDEEPEILTDEEPPPEPKRPRRTRGGGRKVRAAEPTFNDADELVIE